MDNNYVDEVLTSEARELFKQLVQAHLGALGDRTFLKLNTSQGCILKFLGNPQAEWDGIDRGAIADLSQHELIRSEGGVRSNETYRVTDEALAFHRWLTAQEGSSVAQVENVVRTLLEGGEYAARHPGAAHHLREAFDLFGNTEQTIRRLQRSGITFERPSPT